MATSESKLIVSLLDRLSGPAQKINATMSRLNAAATRNAAALDQMRGRMLDAVAAGYAVANAIAAPISSAISFEEKMADVAKVVDFPTPEAFKKMGDDIRAMSLRLPIAADGLADIVAAAGQSGIASQDLLRFTELAAKVATAWDVTAGEAGDAMAKLKTALGRSVEDTAALADAMNHLGNKTAASSKQILDFTSRVAPMASTFGMTAEQAAAIGAAMIGAGFDADVASTSFLNAGYALTAGTQATKGQRDGFKKLGLSASKVSKAMQKDAVGTLDDVLSRIRRLPKDAQASTMQQIFGKEAKALAPLLTNAKLLGETLAYVADKSKYAGSAQAEFDQRSKTTANNLQLFKNRLADLGISIGNSLTPGLNKLMDAIEPTITSLARLAESYPKVAAGAVGAVGSIIGLTVAMTGLRWAFLLVKGGVLSMAAPLVGLAAKFATAATESVRLQAALKAMSGLGKLTALESIGAALRGMIWAVPGVSMLAGALGAIGTALAAITAPAWIAIAAAVALVAAAGAALYKYWDRIKAVVSGVATAISARLEPVLQSLQPLLDALRPVLEPIGAAFGTMADAVGRAWEKLKSFFDGISGLFSQEVLSEADKNRISANAAAMTDNIINAFTRLPGEMLRIGGEIIQSLWDGMTAKFSEFMAWVRSIPSQITGALSGIKVDFGGTKPIGPGKSAATPQSVTPVDGARAKGGPVWPGGAFLVGENGPEIFSPGRSGMISPNEAYSAARAGQSARGSSPANVNVHFAPTFNITSPQSPQHLGDAIMAELGRKVRNTIYASYSDGAR